MQIEHIDISGMGKRVGKDSLSLRKAQEKIASSLLERDFFLCFATPRRRRGGMSERSDEIPERGMRTALAPAFQLARAPRRGVRDVGAQRRNP